MNNHNIQLSKDNYYIGDILIILQITTHKKGIVDNSASIPAAQVLNPYE